MKTIESIVREIQRELTPQFEQKLRSYLQQQDREWLIEQVIRLTLDAHSLHEMDRKTVQEMKSQQRAARIVRVTDMALDERGVRAFVQRYRGFNRDRLVEEGYLLPTIPAKGTALIEDPYRTPKGQALLREAKDTLYALLFGDESTNTHLPRAGRHLLTVIVPEFKLAALDFMQASTELSSYGTWQDPDSLANEVRASNTLIQVEYGEVAGEPIADAIVTALTLINSLEINEQILYARLESIEQSTLILC
jgi:hypothetical protein